MRLLTRPFIAYMPTVKKSITLSGSARLPRVAASASSPKRRELASTSDKRPSVTTMTSTSQGMPAKTLPADARPVVATATSASAAPVVTTSSRRDGSTACTTSVTSSTTVGSHCAPVMPSPGA